MRVYLYFILKLWHWIIFMSSSSCLRFLLYQGCKWHDGISEKFGHMWKVGDVVSCLLDLDSQTMCEFLLGGRGRKRGGGERERRGERGKGGRDKKEHESHSSEKIKQTHGCWFSGRETVGILDKWMNQFPFDGRQLAVLISTCTSTYRDRSGINIVAIAELMMDALSLSNVKKFIHIHLQYDWLSVLMTVHCRLHVHCTCVFAS